MMLTIMNEVLKLSVSIEQIKPPAKNGEGQHKLDKFISSFNKVERAIFDHFEVMTSNIYRNSSFFVREILTALK